ncbi:List-Bact-rpt repeat protein [Winogradskyella arenosi]|uniref:List-Bact-rpt repeat protein n=2 Tax=Winogradskyella arenosi TaxID=533325 RepID=A0A368ZI35_9FLAO|nr:List-Bact-rpt repeat protein [Winogradskyella arenosi]
MIWSGYGQTKIAELTFETPGGYTTSVTEFSDGSLDYFTRTDGTDIGNTINFTNIQGSYYFAAHDIDGEVSSANQRLYFTGINISGYTTLEVRIHIAEDDDGSSQDWDAADYFHLNGNIDTGTDQNLIWVESSGGTNTTPAIDTDYNGSGDGTHITDAFAQFTKSIAGTGTNLDLELIFNLDSGDEDIAIDNIEIWGVSAGPPTYSVTYNGNSNTGGATPTDSNAYDPGDTVTVLGNTGALVNTCNSFNGWNTKADGSGTSYVASDTFTISDNTTLYAQWTPTGNTVTYNANGGTGTMSPQTNCSATNLTANAFTNSGFTFNSWNTAADGSGASYADEASYSFASDITLYAQWDVFVGPCAEESFNNIPASTGSYTTQNWTGDDGVNWTATISRTDQTLNGRAITTDGGKLTSDTFTGGIGSLTVSTQREFGGSSGTFDLNVNGTFIATIPYDDTIQTTTINNINVGGNVIIELDLNTGDRVSIDDLSWTCYTACSAPADPVGSITGTTPVCTSTDLTFSGTAPAGITNYWQTTATGTDETYNASSTYTATTSGTYYVRAYDTAGTCWSDGNLSYTVVIEEGVPTLTQPTDQTEVIPDTATFSVSSSNTDSYQWQVNTGSGWNNVTDGSGTTTDTYTTIATSTPMNGNQYRCILTNICGTTTSNAVTLNLSNDSPNNATGLEGCLGETSIDLSWNASSGTLTPTGYIVFAQPGSTVPTSTAAAAGDASAYTANTNYTLATTYGTLGKAVFKGNSTNATITGLTSGNDYTFKVVAYYSEDLTGWATGINNTGSWNDTFTIGMPEATFTSASIAPTSSVLSWTNPLPTSCYELLIVANQGGITSFTPTNGNTYAANATYSGANSIVFAGNGITTTVSGLTDGLEYCYTIFVRNVATGEWSSGTSICQTTGLSYCESSGGDSTDSGILNVSLNTIDEDSDSEDAYTDFTTVTTDLTIGETYPLSVNVNTGGNYTSYVKVWIDWDRDGSFNSSSNEAIELGILDDDNNGQPSLSPVNITVPSDAYIGNVRMRVSSRSDSWPERYATSCEDFGYGEVEDYIINIIRPAGAEIHVEGNNNTILNGDITTSGLNNTSFGTTNIGNTIVKTFTIESLGAATLNLTGSPDVQITGTNATDFVVTSQPTDSNLSSGEHTDFVITFTPSGSGIRTATVEIATNDSDENPFTFAIQGTGECNPATYDMSPSTGPAGTVVTITTTSGSNADYATALYDGVATTVNYISPSVFEITIPNNAISGNISFDDITGCTRYLPFTVITSDITSCDGLGSLPTDIFISEVTDRDSSVDGHSYVELHNATGNAVNISNYNIEIHSNGSSSANGIINIPNGTTLADGDTYVISFGTGSTEIDPVSQHDYFSSNTIGLNDSDHLILNNGTINIDLWGDTSGTPFTGGVGTDYSDDTPNGSDYTYRRNYRDTSLPSMTWDPADWTLITPLNYSDIGNYNFSIGDPPIISVEPTDSNFACEFSASFTITGTESYNESDDTQDLAYQWYYTAPGDSGWTEILPSNSNYTGQQSATLNVIDTVNFNGYQYYCQLRENNESCFQASHAANLEVLISEWNGSSWSIAPTIHHAVILDANYNTSTHGNFSACSLVINSGKTLTITDGAYAEVYYDVNNNGTFHIENNGALIQIDDTSVNTGSMSMERKASIKNYDYVYWSSPISGFNISDIAGSYYFYWHPTTINSNGTQGNWIAANNTTMDLGKGYIIRAPNGQTAPATPGELNFTTTFSSSTPGEGVPNNGEIAVTIERGINANSDEDKNDNWNLIGNPYPSAISASDFIIENAAQLQNIDGYINIWTHGTPPSTAEPSPFYQNFANNYNSADYFYYNALGDSNGDGFSGYIAAGQSFMVNMVDGSEAATTTVTFNNSMRDKGYSNSDFFRASPNSSNEKHRFWLNLLTPTTPTNRILVGYTEAATMGEDLLFDAETVLGETSAGVYSMIDDDYFLIQGRALPFAVTDIIPLSVKTIESGSHTLALHAVDGIFETDNQTIYLKDNVLGFTHDLTAQPYTFTLEPGTYNDRFEIVFIPSTLSIDDHQSLSNTITITELTEDLVQFNVDGPHSIKHIDIIDINGRLVYSLEGHNSTEVYNLSRLSQAAYMAKITLSNGQVLSKKALKQY